MNHKLDREILRAGVFFSVLRRFCRQRSKSCRQGRFRNLPETMSFGSHL